MKLSHAKLTTILTCPATYYLNYEQKIKPKTKSAALSIGSAVHWGIEHNTEDLADYYKTGSFNQKDNYTKEQVLAEGMVHGYLKHKDELFEKILSTNGSKLELIEESHELYFTANLESALPNHKGHEFEGIIDLLLLTDKGFVIIDYKTSSAAPDWDKYLDQIYRYIFLLRESFPDVPIVKIGIINLRKTMIRKKTSENDIQFLQRMKMEYDINDDDLINYHEYLPEALDQQLLDNYIKNLSKMADAAEITEKSKVWYINYANANGVYGKSQYWDIFYRTPGAEVLYEINDFIWDEDDQEFKTKRDCRKIDMDVLVDPNILNHYSQYKDLRINVPLEDVDIFQHCLTEAYTIDEDLIAQYEITYQKELEKGGN